MASNDRFSEEETQRRFEASLKAALNTPPKPMKDKPKKRERKASDGASPAAGSVTA